MEDNKIILVTGFEPFGGDNINPTELVIDKLPDAINGFLIKKILLPVEFINGPKILIEEYDKIKPSAVIMFGQAGGRSAITPELQGKNIMDVYAPDNSGYQPSNLPIINNGPDILLSTLPLDKIIEGMNALNIPCELSKSAGTYVCNCLLYNMLYYNKGEVPTGFIHVPFIKEQNHLDKPSFEFDDVYTAVLTILDIITK
ncbi:MAG: pyroglutamyl-peptidase I [Bacilli bacterium]|nr:pyroglutamyl-peptidase I [Bacilli bacterium]